MSVYKWMLRRGSRKEVCPSCGKRRFVPYVLTADPSVSAGPEYGRCDREQSCGYLRYPGSDVKTAEPQEAGPFGVMEGEPLRFPAAETVAKARVTDANTLWQAYNQLLPAQDLLDAMRMYRIDTAPDGSCIYWQWDGAENGVRTGKAIMYGKDGHRKKREDGEALPVYWYHKLHEQEGKELQQCLFGQHLLIVDKKSPVLVVESEKTAVLMTAYELFIQHLNADIERHIYLACGGSQMLKGAIDLSCLFGRRVMLVPDDGQWLNWSRTANAYGWGCIDIEEIKAKTGQPDGCDIWDCYEQALMDYRGGGRR